MFTENEQNNIVYRGYNPDFVRRVLAKREQFKPAVPVVCRGGRVEDIIRQTAAKHGVGKLDILGPSRKKNIVAARYEAINAAAAAWPSLSMRALGRIFNRDATTISYSLARSA